METVSLVATNWPHVGTCRRRYRFHTNDAQVTYRRPRYLLLVGPIPRRTAVTMPPTRVRNQWVIDR